MGSRNDYGCLIFDEAVVLRVAIVTAGPGFTFLLYKFSQVNDAFRLRREFTWVFITTILSVGERTEVHPVVGCQ